MENKMENKIKCLLRINKIAKFFVFVVLFRMVKSDFVVVVKLFTLTFFVTNNS